MKTWQEISLRDVTLRITKGTTPTTLGFNFTEAGVNFIKAESITRTGNIIESTFAKIDDKTHNALKRSQIIADDILVTIAGVYLGKIGLVKKHHTPANTNQAVAIVRPDKQKVVPSFIKYFLIEPSTTTYLNMLCPQSAQPNLNLTQLGKVKFKIPTYAIQRKIAAVLSTYDDLIENHNRRIAILEKMADDLYREWFVRLRFPGHQKMKIVKGLPEGWAVKSIGDLIEHQIGGGWGQETPTGSENVPVYIIRGTDFKSIEKGDFSTSPLRYEKQSSIASRSLKHGDIILENSVNAQSRCTGNTIIITDQILKQFDHQLIPASFCKLIRFKDPSLAFYMWMLLRCYYDQGSMEYFQNVATNGIANFQMTRFLKRFEVKIPEDANLAKLFWLFDSSKHKSVLQTLACSRDRLLSRLMSGKIDVAKMDIHFPASMAGEAMANA